MAHDPKVCERVCRAVTEVGLREMMQVKADGGDLDLEASLHGLARGAGTVVASLLLAAGIPPMLHHSAVMQFLQLTSNGTFAELVDLQKPDGDDLADVKPQGRA